MKEIRLLHAPSSFISADTADLASLFVGAVIEYGRISREEEIERQRIQAMKEVKLKEIREVRECFMAFMEHHFAERKSVFEELFIRLDDAIENGDSRYTEMTLAVIVELAKAPSFRKFREMLMDPASELVI